LGEGEEHHLLKMQTDVERFIVRFAKLFQSVVAALKYQAAIQAESTGPVEKFD